MYKYIYLYIYIYIFIYIYYIFIYIYVGDVGTSGHSLERSPILALEVT